MILAISGHGYYARPPGYKGLASCHCPLNTLSFRRSRVQIAAPVAAVCAVLLLGLWIRVADAQQQQLAQQQDVVLAPHRATYDMKLSVARPNSGIIEVVVMNADGSANRRLTPQPADGHSPAWSPDGRKLMFSSRRDGNWEVYVMNPDGSDQRNLTRNPRSDGSATWSPDGRKIAFVTRRDGNWEVYVMNPDGSDQRNLTRNPGNDGPQGWGAAWSPDGRKITFVSDRDGNSEVYVMNADGSGQRRLTHRGS